MQRFEVEVEIDGAWASAPVGAARDLPVKGFSAEVEAAAGSAYRVRHTEFYAGVESPFSEWSVPGVLVPEPSVATSLITLALLLAAMNRRRA